MILIYELRSKISALILISIIILSCSPNNKNNEIEKIKTDYSDKNNWLSIPENINEKEADIFYLYPTIWTRSDTNESIICPINYIPMRRGTTNVMLEQTGIFEEIGNIYAPFYRQADALYLMNIKNNISREEQYKYFYSYPKEDAIAAFDYYIKNYNNGRPFILAGHSQGAMMIKKILIDYFKTNDNIKNRMVAAYIFGYSVTKKDLKENTHLRFANGEYDTGVIISYNTESPNFNGYNPVVLEDSIAINPITWTLEETLASKEESFGADIFSNFGKPSKIADAQVDKARGVVKCGSINPDDFYLETGGVFEKGVYHIYDIALYYYDLKENARKRLNAFWK
ncbi:DUF3089 domain-containing protein [uncultured Brachyspira sp.]|uniref:DUF3089 domain-containing protein n=1 Tax=uncultured Brachyspira sp. TaxID=221953 RepID=UPI0025DB6AB9|nr:DUF3089 domain-containing protein [uncultured Brachyspira sp.]